MQDILRKLWQFISFVFVIYGFYLLFLFFWDTLNRLSEGIALPVSVSLTLIVVGVSGYFWIKKHLKRVFG